MLVAAAVVEKIALLAMIDRAIGSAGYGGAVAFLPNGEYTCDTEPFKQGFPERAVFRVHVPDPDPGTRGAYVPLEFTRHELRDDARNIRVFVYFADEKQAAAWEAAGQREPAS